MATTRWSIPLDRLAAKARARLDVVVRRSTFELFRRVVLASPVDTGRFRANWNVSYNTPDATTTASKNTGRAISEAARALTLPVGGIVYLVNGLPYAQRLEYGWSDQAPSGMVRIAVTQFAAAVRAAVAAP